VRQGGKQDGASATNSSAASLVVLLLPASSVVQSRTQCTQRDHNELLSQLVTPDRCVNPPPAMRSSLPSTRANAPTSHLDRLHRCQPIQSRATAAAVALGPARRRHRCACRAESGEKQQQQSPPPKAAAAEEPERYAYSDPVNKALGNFLPKARDAAAELSHVDWGAPKAAGLPLQQLAERFTAEFLQREWFVTGDVPVELFSDAFAFKDDSVATSGIKSYALGVRKLFDQATARAELIEVVADEAARAIVATWRLEGAVNLPLKPRIPPYVVTTTLGVGEDGLIVSQVDAFSQPGWKLLAGALLGAWAGPAPAPAAEVLRAEAAAAGRPGVVGGGGDAAKRR